MQQAILVERAAICAAAGQEPAAPATNAFVINLVSSTTPVALTRPDHAGLKRFTFFVSRRREDGRERFRLHMGYFDTQEEAEKLLDIVRAIYPGAWAGLAPGRRLNSSAAAVPPAPTAPPAPTPRTAAPVPRATGIESPSVLSQRAPASIPALALVPDEGRRLTADVTEQERAVHAGRTEGTRRGVGADRQAATRSLSNVRQTIASLDESIIPTLQPPVARSADSASTPLAARTGGKDPGPELSDSGTMRLLETGSPARGAPSDAGHASAPVSGQAAAPRPEKPYFAVQLMWSVQPIALSQVPLLAIFSAYTLYGAEGNRDGRRWYGLRLGFFTDAVSAKQVAHYVRADFSTVSVVPVSEREREQAKLAVARAALGSSSPGGRAAEGAAKPNRGPLATVAGGKSPVRGSAGGAAKSRLKDREFAFIEDSKSPAVTAITAAQTAATGSAGQSAGSSLRPGGRPMRGAPGKRAKVRPPGQVHARAHVKPKTLEETLEILGANQLQVDDEPGASLNDSGVRHLRLETKGKHSKLLRLFDRLSDRLGS